jgi:hypothetical protein
VDPRSALKIGWGGGGSENRSDGNGDRVLRPDQPEIWGRGWLRVPGSMSGAQHMKLVTPGYVGHAGNLVVRR